MDEYPDEPVEVEALTPLTDTAPVESVVVDQIVLDQASIGSVMYQGADRPIAEGWHALDGSVQMSVEWPDFVQAKGVTDPTFTLPAPERGRRELVFIIKLGERVPLVENATTTIDPSEARKRGLRGRP